MKKLLKKIKLAQGFLHGDISFTGPHYVNIDITTRCNLQCLCCRWHSPLLQEPSQGIQTNRDFPFNLFEKLCKELNEMNTNSIVFIGTGEPMLHPRIYDMISVAKDNGLEVIMFANGTLLNEPAVKSLIDSQLDILKVSLFATSTDEYKKQYPQDNPKNFNKVITGLQLLSRLKAEQKNSFPYVELSHPINSLNFKKIEAMVDLACKTGINKLSYSVMQPTAGRNESGREKLQPFLMSQEEVKSANTTLNRIKKRLHSLSLPDGIGQAVLRYSLGEYGWKKFPCYIPWYYTYFTVNGKVLACQRRLVPMGDLKKNSFHEIWNNSAFRTFRRESLVHKGLTSTKQRCDCSYCPHIVNNYRTHRFLKWLLPFRKLDNIRQ